MIASTPIQTPFIVQVPQLPIKLFAVLKNFQKEMCLAILCLNLIKCALINSLMKSITNWRNFILVWIQRMYAKERLLT
jgi:hypothetical protein